MKNFNIAIEKGKRYLKENKIISFYFIATEFIFNKDDIVTGNYRVEFKNKEFVFFTQSLMIDVENRKVIVENSHEDPLTESENHFFICGQLTKELIKSEYQQIECLFYFGDKIIRKQLLSTQEINSLFLVENWYSEIDRRNIYQIITQKDCIIRMHLGKNDSVYTEEEYLLKKENSFDFSQYLEQYEYVAVQCSYEEGCDIEEKHVLKGLKGIWNSKYYINGERYIPMIPFSENYTTTSNEGFTNITSMKDLLNYYITNKNDSFKIFEMNDKFLENYYKEYKTTAIGKIYSSIESKKFHIDSDLCNYCPDRSACMQLVPSGLSELLFKKNLIVENFENCSINKIINKKE